MARSRVPVAFPWARRAPRHPRIVNPVDASVRTDDPVGKLSLPRRDDVADRLGFGPARYYRPGERPR